MITDLRCGKIYNWLTFPLIITGWIAHTAAGGLGGLGGSLVGTLLGSALYLGFALFGLVGMGDVKLLGAIGAWGGAAFAVRVFLWASALGLPHAVIVLWLNYGRNAFAILATRYWTGDFLKQRLHSETPPGTYKFYLGQDIFLGSLGAAYFQAPPIPFLG